MKRSYRTFPKLVTLLSICLGVLAGCSAPDVAESSSDTEDSVESIGNKESTATWPDTPQNIELTRVEMGELAQAYFFENYPKSERQWIFQTVRSLTSEQSDLFFDILKELQLERLQEEGESVDEEAQMMIEIGRVVGDFARERGLNRLRLTKEEFHEALAIHYHLSDDLLEHMNNPIDTNPIDPLVIPEAPSDFGMIQQPACGFGYASCSTTTYTATAYGGNCANCINGSSFDRTSNEACEFGACDHRIFYPSASLKNAVDGKTATADCVIHYYGGIISRWESGNTQLGYGIAGPAWCGIFYNVSEYLRDKTQMF